MSLRILTDENVATSTVQFLRQRTVDVKTAAEAGLLGKGDAKVLGAAQREKRAVLTLDKDFGNILVNPPTSGSGVILLDLKSQKPGVVNEVLGRFLIGKSQNQIAGRLFVLDEVGVRVRG